MQRVLPAFLLLELPAPFNLLCKAFQKHHHFFVAMPSNVLVFFPFSMLFPILQALPLQFQPFCKSRKLGSRHWSYFPSVRNGLQALFLNYHLTQINHLFKSPSQTILSAPYLYIPAPLDLFCSGFQGHFQFSIQFQIFLRILHALTYNKAMHFILSLLPKKECSGHSEVKQLLQTQSADK